MSYVSPKAARTDRGLVAAQPLTQGEVVAVFGGRCVGRSEFDALDLVAQHSALQVDDDVFLVDPTSGPGQLVTHSCSPSCGLRGATTLVSLGAIAVGEPLTYDFATSQASSCCDFECTCASASCRGKITGDDWMLPELQLRYRGHFSPYLAARIASLSAAGAGRRAFAY